MNPEPRFWHVGGIDEDDLTENTFRALHYVPRALQRFLEALRETNVPCFLESAPAPEDVHVWPGFAWEFPPHLKKAFGAIRRKGPNRPAAVKHSALPDALVTGCGWALIVESEYSKEFEADQMLEHFVAARSIGWKHREDQCFHLLLNDALGRPGSFDSHLRRRSSELVEAYGQELPECRVDPDEVVRRTLWFNWGGMRTCVEQCLQDASLTPLEVKVLTDCVALYEHAEIRTVVSPQGPLAEVLDESRIVAMIAERIPAASWAWDDRPLLHVLEAASEVEALIESLSDQKRRIAGGSLDPTRR